MRYQIVTISDDNVTTLYVEPSTYYPTIEAAKAQFDRIEGESPVLKGQLKVIKGIE